MCSALLWCAGILCWHVKDWIFSLFTCPAMLCRQSPGGVGDSGALELPMGKVKVYSGGGKSGKLKQALSKTQKPKGKRHAAGKHGSFKSKGKHKRR